jgi:hypothetical protein
MTEIFECQRAAFHGLERGPIAIAIEHHDFVSVPDACFGTTRRFMSVLTRLWVDDEEFATALGSWHGMPVGVAAINHAENQTTRSTRWWFIPEGYNASAFETPIIESVEGSSTTTRGFAWPNQGGVAVLEIHSTMTKYTTNVLPATGVMNPPTQWSQWSHESPFVAQVDIMNSVTLRPGLVAYADELCTVPLDE